jgi:hypothetical protein
MEKFNYRPEETENNEKLEASSSNFPDGATDETECCADGREENESTQERQELSVEQKLILKKIWAEMVVDSTSSFDDIENLEQENFKKELYKKTMGDVDNLIDEWGLEPDQELIELIKKNENEEERAVLELEYIKREHAKIDDQTKNFKKIWEKSTRWDSWPKRMRETKEFNCVGATLLGISYLERAGIKSYFGSPYGHAVNIARLSNNDWWYVDFRNGKRSVIKIEPEETFTNKVKVLKINNPNIAYGLIPVFDNSEIIAPIIGNLSTLKHEAHDPDISDERIEKKEAQEYLKKYEDNFSKIDFKTVQQSLSPDVANMEETEEMKREEKRILSLIDFEKPFQDYMKNLSQEQRRGMIEEAKIRKEKIENLFYEGDETILSEAGPELKKALTIFLQEFQKMKENQPEIYEENIDIIVNRISNL